MSAPLRFTHAARSIITTAFAVTSKNNRDWAPNSKKRLIARCDVSQKARRFFSARGFSWKASTFDDSSYSVFHSFFYVQAQDEVVVIAVFHSSRNPNEIGERKLS